MTHSLLEDTLIFPIFFTIQFLTVTFAPQLRNGMAMEMYYIIAILDLELSTMIFETFWSLADCGQCVEA